MLGDGSCRVLLYILGYLVPSYSCFKSLEQKDAEKIKEWCIYWLLLALFTTVERLALDWLVFWLPLYYEAKLLFVLYLWHPKTKGAMYLYVAHVQPFLLQHEATVDQHFQEATTWMQDYMMMHFQRFTRFLQSKAHVAVAALQHMQQNKLDQMETKKAPEKRTETKRGPEKQQQPPPPHKRKPSSSSLDDLPSAPTTKIE